MANTIKCTINGNQCIVTLTNGIAKLSILKTDSRVLAGKYICLGKLTAGIAKEGRYAIYLPSNLTNKISSPNLLCPSGNQLVS